MIVPDKYTPLHRCVLTYAGIVLSNLRVGEGSLTPETLFQKCKKSGGHYRITIGLDQFLEALLWLKVVGLVKITSKGELMRENLTTNNN